MGLSLKTNPIDYTKMQYIRVHVSYGENRFNVDIPAPGIVPSGEIPKCSVSVVGISDQYKLEPERGWSWAGVVVDR